MAFQSVGYVAPQDIVQTKKGRKGGGELGAGIGAVAGGVIGGLAGAAATVATGGAAAPAVAAGAMGGAAAGGGLGRQVGNWIDPGKAESTAITRRMGTTGMQTMQSGQTETLRQSLMALQTQPDDVKAQYARPLVEAYVASTAQQPQRTA